MKRFLLFLSVVVLAENVTVHSQTLLPTQAALTSGTIFPNNLGGYHNNSSAYSYGNLIIQGNPTDLFVFTWDNFSSGGSGLAIRQGLTYYDESAFFLMMQLVQKRLFWKTMELSIY